jgi:hypothetical protein
VAVCSTKFLLPTKKSTRHPNPEDKTIDVHIKLKTPSANSSLTVKLKDSQRISSHGSHAVVLHPKKPHSQKLNILNGLLVHVITESYIN